MIFQHYITKFPKWLITVLVSTVIGLSFGLYIYFSYDHRWIRVLTSIITTVIMGLTMMLVIYQRNYFTRISHRQSIKAIIVIGMLIVAALIGTDLSFTVQHFMLSKPMYHFFTAGDVYILNVFVVLVTGIPIYVHEEWKSSVNARITNQQFHLLEMEQQQTLFELHLLRSKIDPHFLYNVHNSIVGLISEKPKEAEKLVMLLSRFLRFSLHKNSVTFHQISDEIEIVETYLQMQEIRFGDRMTYGVEVNEDVDKLEIPSFILQPLVENAIKHGVESVPGRGTIKIRIRPKQKHIEISIEDSGPPFADRPSNGVGLHIVVTKLKLLYQDDFSLELINIPFKHVRLIIPKKT